MKTKHYAGILLMALQPCLVVAEGTTNNTVTPSTEKKESKLTLGGYGEITTSRYFYSDSYLRYTDPKKYKNVKSRGTFDLPHVTFFVGYDFGRGWKMNAEIEYEHGGTGSAMDIENNEGGEIESEVEKGGEVELEQFWIEKSFNRALNLRMGHLVVPVGRANAYHLPNEFFSVYRPEEEATLFPNTWHQTGISLHGRLGNWRYEVQALQGLTAEKFSDAEWVKNGAKDCFEFGRSSQYAAALRIDNYSIPGLRWAVSGYYGGSARNTAKHERYEKYNAKGIVTIGSFDFEYNRHNWIVRGNFDYGHLSDSQIISKVNRNLSNNSGSPMTNVASDVMAYSIEAGYDVFSQIPALSGKQKLYLYGHYGFYDSMYDTEKDIPAYKFYNRRLLSAGINYYPIKEVVVKAEYNNRLFHQPYNNEQTVSLAICYAGFFNL